jgi:demethylmacrocin O-methyltransferase
VIIEKGDNREGTNKEQASGHFYGSSEPPADPA